MTCQGPSCLVCKTELIMPEEDMRGSSIQTKALGAPSSHLVFDLGLPDSHPGAIWAQERLNVPIYEVTWRDKKATQGLPRVWVQDPNLWCGDHILHLPPCDHSRHLRKFILTKFPGSTGRLTGRMFWEEVPQTNEGEQVVSHREVT